MGGKVRRAKRSVLHYIEILCLKVLHPFVIYSLDIHSNLSYPGSAGPEGARITEFARISEVRIREVPAPVTQKST